MQRPSPMLTVRQLCLADGQRIRAVSAALSANGYGRTLFTYFTFPHHQTLVRSLLYPTDLSYQQQQLMWRQQMSELCVLTVTVLLRLRHVPLNSRLQCQRCRSPSEQSRQHHPGKHIDKQRSQLLHQPATCFPLRPTQVRS